MWTKPDCISRSLPFMSVTVWSSCYVYGYLLFCYSFFTFNFFAFVFFVLFRNSRSFLITSFPFCLSLSPAVYCSYSIWIFLYIYYLSYSPFISVSLCMPLYFPYSDCFWRFLCFLIYISLPPSVMDVPSLLSFPFHYIY